MDLFFQGASNNRSISDACGTYGAFVQKCVYDYNSFKDFKRNPDYTQILEHTSQSIGQSYLNVIKEQTPKFYENLKIFKINDNVGNPVIHNYDGVEISPSTLRYVKVASDIAKIFGKDIGSKIAEIGTGYGGQYLIMDKVFSMKEYHLFDMDIVLKLNEKYLECFTLNSSYKTTTLNRHSGYDEYDLVISNYAFSELPIHIQKKYIDKVISKSKKGYMTMNKLRLQDGSYGLNVDELKDLLPKFDVIEEIPLTAPDNYIIVWGN